MSVKKPTGSTGPFKIEAGQDGEVEGGFAKVQFPQSKEEIEKFVFDRYVQAMDSRDPVLTNVIQNRQNHFDFTVSLPDESKHFVDLVEFILSAPNGSPYTAADGLITHKEVADQMLATVRKKSDHYGKPGKTPIDLLVYMTHYRFAPSEEAVRLVQHSLKVCPPTMGSVQLLRFRSQDIVRPRMLYPVAGDPLEGHAPETFQDLTFMNLDPGSFEIVVNRDAGYGKA